MKILAAASVLALVAGQSFAGSLAEPVPTPVIAPVPAFVTGGWDGAYLGAQGGYIWANTDSVDVGSAEDWLGGINAGYLLSSGRFVYGGELAYSWINDINIDKKSNPVGFGGSLDGIGQIKAKLGYDLGQALVYGVAGAAYADGDITGPKGKGSSDWGWLAGAGVDYKLTDNWILGGEAVYHQFDNFDGTGTDLDATTLVARVEYKF